MKKSVFRMLCLILATVSFLFVFASCGTSNETVISCDGVNINEEAYQYWYIQLKDYYIESYSDMEDDLVFWNSEYPEMGMTYGEFFDKKIRKQIEYYLAGNVLFERYDLSLDNAVIDKIDLEIDDGINAFGSRSAYDEYLEERYCVNSRALRKIKIMEQKFSAVYQHLYNDKTGIEKPTSEELESFYRDYYAKIKYYMVPKNFDYVYDDKGNRVTNANGNYEMKQLDEAGRLENKQHAEEAFAKVQGGEDIDTFIKKYYADIAKVYPNGYYVLENDNYGAMFTPTIIKAAFSIEVGDVTLCENDDAFFIVQRFSLPDQAYTGADKAQFGSMSTDAAEQKFVQKFNAVLEEIEINTEVLDKYSVTTVR